MLSNSAFNAMLKTLEEPPEHVKFILATTDPQKIPVTVLSRCLQFNLKQMTQPLIADHLRHILEVEVIWAEPGALQLLARSAAGSMRDALSLLDQAIAHGSGKVEEAQVREMLGAVDLDHLFSIVDALLAGDATALLRVADDMAARSLSFDAALQEMAGLFTRIQIAQLAPLAIADDMPERLRLLEIASRLDPEFVQLAYQIAVHGRQELPLAPDEQAGFIMTLLRLHAFRPLLDGAAGTHPAPGSSGVGAQTVPEPRVTASDSGLVHDERGPLDPPVEQVVLRAAAEPGRPAGDWPDILTALKIGGMARELAQHCELRELLGARIVLRLSPTHRHLLMKPAQDKLQQSLGEYFARPLQLTIELQEVSGDTPAAAAQRDRRERMDRAIASVEQDGFVREVIEVFDATLIESSIKPV
jgi:DNA polymerase-3 subunit gamma/tau